jgi:hypothetical protein
MTTSTIVPSRRRLSVVPAVVALGASLLAFGCSSPTAEDDGSAVQEAAATGVRKNVVSTHARPGAEYMESRSFPALVEIGAATPVQKTIMARLAAYGRKELAVDTLLFAEEPARFATFLPEEQAAFDGLWALLEIGPAVDVDTPPSFPALASLVTTQRPETARYDETTRVPITALPAVLQAVARRVVKTPSADPATVSFDEVTKALANYAVYTSGEYFRFDALLRAIEAHGAKPSSFPHLAIAASPDGAVDIAVGPGALHVARTTTKACDTQFRGAGVSTKTTITATAPADVKLTWTPITKEGTLARANSSYGYGRDLAVVPMDATAAYPLKVGGGGRAAAIVEAFRAGARVAQTVVVLTGDEGVGGEGLAIAEGGAFVCTPFADAADVTTSLPDVVRVPPGRYTIPTPTYGDATLALYGLGVMRLDVGGKSFWKTEKPSPTSPSPQICWALTSLGPRNDVTGASGAGPGFGFEFGSSKVYFAEQSYGICSYGRPIGGTLVATLTAAGRL